MTERMPRPDEATEHACWLVKNVHQEPHDESWQSGRPPPLGMTRPKGRCSWKPRVVATRRVFVAERTLSHYILGLNII